MSPNFYYLYRPILVPRIWLSREEVLRRYPR